MTIHRIYRIVILTIRSNSIMVSISTFYDLSAIIG